MLEGLTRPTARTGFCKVADLAKRLPPGDGEILLKAVEDQDWPAKALSRQLREREVLISDTTILRHRRGECPCPKLG